MLLYLKCFLTSFPAPRKGSSLTLLGSPQCSSCLSCPTALLGQPKFPTAACHHPLHLHQLQFLSDAPATQACPLPPPLAAFKLFILYLWFWALRKILVFFTSSPFAESE